MWLFISWEQVSHYSVSRFLSSWVCRAHAPAPCRNSVGLPSAHRPQPLYPYPTGPVDAEIYQTPPFRLTRAGQDVTLECKQNLRYNAMYWWYRHDPGQELRLIYYSKVEKGVQRGDIPEGLTVRGTVSSHCQAGSGQPNSLVGLLW